MINLIPPEEKKRMARGFYGRLVILFLLMLSFITLVAFIAILPAYFFSSVKVNIINAKLDTQSKEPMPLPDPHNVASLKDLNIKLSLIEAVWNSKFTVSKNVFNAIILKKTPNIKITDITYSKDSNKNRKINVQGNASSREALILFRRALEDDVAFKQVDLPISNFVKGSNIKFFLTLIPV